MSKNTNFQSKYMLWDNANVFDFDSYNFAFSHFFNCLFPVTFVHVQGFSPLHR